MAANFTTNFLAGATSGTVVAGISGGDIGSAALMGGVIAGAFSLGRDAAFLMRAKMLEQSTLDPINSSGKSGGFNGDGKKLGGGRYDPFNPNAKPSPLGGCQGGEGQIFGMPYESGGIVDRIVEAYAGTHDYLNSWAYDAYGNIRNLNAFESAIGTVMNPLNVVIATPIVVTSAIPQTAYSAPSIIYGLPDEKGSK